MIATILEILKGLLQAIPLIAKYFPPKATETKVEEDEAAIAKRLASEQSSGRPQ